MALMPNQFKDTIRFESFHYNIEQHKQHLIVSLGLQIYIVVAKFHLVDTY